MDPEKKPHPNCGVPMEEVNFMQNIISGEFPGDSQPEVTVLVAKPNYIEILLFELRQIIESARRTIPLEEVNR